MCPKSPLACKRVVTPSSQAKKSVLAERTGMWETVGKVFKTFDEEV